MDTSTQSPAKLLPKLKICDVFNYKNGDKEAFKEAILSKNNAVNELVNDGKTLEVIFIDGEYNYAVLKVSPEIREIVMRDGRIFIDMQAHHVKDRLHLTQCYSCQKYGHKQGSDFCPHKGTSNEVCKFCAGNHKSKDCPVKNDKSKHKCANCASSKILSIRQGACSHIATSRDCPIAIRELKYLASRTATVSSKN